MKTKSFITGHLHSDNKRFSVIFSNGCLFTFELHKKSEKNESGFMGEIGEVKDFSIN